MDINATLAKEFNLKQEQVDNTVALIDDDKTIPFIARYRKEATGALDDVVLRELSADDSSLRPRRGIAAGRLHREISLFSEYRSHGQAVSNIRSISSGDSFI